MEVILILIVHFVESIGSVEQYIVKGGKEVKSRRAKEGLRSQGLRGHLAPFRDTWIKPDLLRGGDVIIFNHPTIEGMQIVKRISEIKQNSVRVLGDNPRNSLDSRTLGDIPKLLILKFRSSKYQKHYWLFILKSHCELIQLKTAHKKFLHFLINRLHNQLSRTPKRVAQFFQSTIYYVSK